MSPPALQPSRGEEPQQPRGNFGLCFESVGEEEGQQLEAQFTLERQLNQISADRLLSAGGACLHLLLALKLQAHGEPGLALLALATAAQQLLTATVAWIWPHTFLRLRPLAYLLGLTWPMVQSTLLAGHLQPASCSRPGRGLFWLAQLLASGVPWLAVHALLFPMPLLRGCFMHALALAVAMLGNRRRCQSVLQQCPAAAGHFEAAAQALGSAASLFSAVRAQPTAGGPLGGSTHLGTSSTHLASAAAAPAAVPAADAALRSCMGLYGAAQMGLGYAGALHLAWTLERLARLAFIRRTNNVEAEWHLERKERSAYMLALELLMGLVFAWQLLELGQVLKPLLAWVAAAAFGSSLGVHTEL